MQLRDSIDNTKVLFHKTLQNLKSFIFVRRQKLPRSASLKLNPFSSRSTYSLKNHQTDQHYSDFCNEWKCDVDKEMEVKKSGNIGSKETVTKEVKEEECNSGIVKLQESPLKKKKEETVKEDKGKNSSQSRNLERQFSKSKVEGGYGLAKKMKELEMMDTGDVEHVLDVEEAIHYYNRLKSPVYLDIVDQFFEDMHSELSAPKVSASINCSKRRLGSIRF